MSDRQQGTGSMSEAATGGILLTLERSFRHAPDLTALKFTLVSDPRRLIAYRQAVFAERGLTGSLKVAAVSNVATIDRNAPYIVFIERLLAGLDKTGDLDAAQGIDPDRLGTLDRQDWQEFVAANAWWQPMIAPGGRKIGGMLFIRPDGWSRTEAILIEELADAGAHAYAALGRKSQTSIVTEPKLARRNKTLAGGVALLALLFPVRLSVIAPAEVVPKEPQLIASPMTAVIRDIAVKPNAFVKAGDVLFTFEDAELKANSAIAERAVEEAEAELRRAGQQAFGDARGRAEVALLQARLALRREQAAYAAYELAQVEVKARTDGIAIFADANEWRGRPVSTGERVMAVASPSAAEIQVLIPVSDAINMEPGAAVRLFLDVAPLSAIDGTLERAAYQPVTAPDGTLAYLAVAQFDDPASLPRLGLKGSAKVLGERVPLMLFLFRRPLAAFRQMIGL